MCHAVDICALWDILNLYGLCLGIYTAADSMSCDHKAWTRMWKGHFSGFFGGLFNADFSSICSQTEVIRASSQTGQHLYFEIFIGGGFTKDGFSSAAEPHSPKVCISV